VEEHAAGLGARLEAERQQAERRHQELQAAQGDSRATEARLSEGLDERLEKLRESMYQESFRLVGKECAHKLHAVAYSLLELISEVEIAGATPAEVRDKRSTLHRRLCDRLGSNNNPGSPWSGRDRGQDRELPEEPAAEPAALQASIGSSSMPSLAESALEKPAPADPRLVWEAELEKPLAPEPRRAWKEQPPVQVDFGEPQVYLPPVVQKPATPRPQRMPGRLSDNLREIRSLRLVDYHADWHTS